MGIPCRGEPSIGDRARQHQATMGNVGNVGNMGNMGNMGNVADGGLGACPQMGSRGKAPRCFRRKQKVRVMLQEHVLGTKGQDVRKRAPRRKHGYSMPRGLALGIARATLGNTRQYGEYSGWGIGGLPPMGSRGKAPRCFRRKQKVRIMLQEHVLGTKGQDVRKRAPRRKYGYSMPRGLALGIARATLGNTRQCGEYSG